MFCRFFFALLGVLGAKQALAATNMADWDCRKNAKGEWECVTERKAPEPPALPEAPTPTRPPVEPKRVSAPPPAPLPPPKPTQQAEGWTCKTAKESQKWDCTLVGPDPKGQPRVMEAEGEALLATYDARERQLFRNMVDQMERDPWASCQYTLRESADSAVRDQRETSPLNIDADFSQVYDQEMITFVGNVDATRADQRVKADRGSYNTVSRALTAQGNVMYSDADMALYSDSALLRLAEDQARLRNSLFILNSVPARGSAEAAYRDSKTFSRYRGVTYTTCAPGNDDWLLHASEMKTDQNTGRGSARHAWLEFKGVPFLYTPYISFPIDDRRKSGLLAPSFGSRDETGFDVAVPYYWNIAPNMDATITPRFTTKRGGLLRGEFRYLTQRNWGTVAGEYLPYDAETNEARGQFAYEHHTQFSPGLSADLDLNWVSDEDYLDQLGNTLSFQNRRFVTSRAQLAYNRPGVYFSTFLDNYQTVDKTIPEESKPYRRIPQVLLDLNPDLGDWPVEIGLRNEYVFFHRDNPGLLRAANLTESVDLPTQAQRIDIKPTISLPLESTYGFLIPRVSLQHTQYWLNSTSGQEAKELRFRDLQIANAERIVRGRPGNENLSNQEVHDEALDLLLRNAGFSSDDIQKLDNPPSHISRTLPIVSLDSGLFFERPLDLGESSFVHTLEPRLFYLYVPYENQDDIPLLDSSEYDFNFGQLFRENRFSGADRINDANQLTLALTSRLLDAETGLERISASVGQIFYFDDRRVFIPERASGGSDSSSSVRNETTSNLVAELNAMITDRLAFRSAVQWNPDGSEFERGQASFHYRDRDNNNIFNIGYRYRRDSIEQGDVSFRFPVVTGWNAVGRWLYDFDDQLTLESFLGIERESCCWRLRLIGRRYINFISNPNSDEGDTQTGIFFQLELKGLTSFGDNVERFLDRNIKGYRIPESP